MRIRLDRERAEPITWSETLHLGADLVASGAVQELGPVACEGKVEFVHPGFLLHASLSYERTLRCSRCLRKVTQQATESIEIVLSVPAAAREPAAADEEVELAEDELNVVLVDGDELETSAVIAEQIELQVPMRVLCRDDCKGFCLRCGADRNKTPDCCKETRYDGRWSDLEALRDRLPTDH